MMLLFSFSFVFLSLLTFSYDCTKNSTLYVALSETAQSLIHAVLYGLDGVQ